MDEIKDKIEPYYQAKGKFIVDALFDKKMFHENLTRDDMQATENLLAWILQNEAQSSARATRLLVRLETKKFDS